MKREKTPGEAGHESVVLAVRGGEIVAVVPEGTSDDAAVGAASTLRAALRLENERVLTFEIHDGAARAAFRDEAAMLHEAVQMATPAEAVPARAGSPTASLHAWTAERIMTREVKAASPDELVEDVAKRLVFHNISGMPVEDWDGQLIGIISEIDVIGKINELVRDAMSTDVSSVSASTPVDQIASLMTERRIKRVPVLENGQLVGIVSRADIVRALGARWSTVD